LHTDPSAHPLIVGGSGGVGEGGGDGGGGGGGGGKRYVRPT